LARFGYAKEAVDANPALKRGAMKPQAIIDDFCAALDGVVPKSTWPRPARPAKSRVVNTMHDFAALDVLPPHPRCAWMGYERILSPTASSYAELRPLIE
jgi:hypothetical protein